MSRKICTITVEFPLSNPADYQTPNYLVTKVTDSVRFAPHDILSKATVEDLCDSNNWKVIVVPRRAA